jgi:hypothetical protein
MSNKKSKLIYNSDDEEDNFDIKILNPEEFKNVIYYKIINRKMINKDFKYVEGLNILKEEYKPYGICLRGGFYFCKLHDLVHWLNLYSDGLVYEVRIPPDASVSMHYRKYKADRIIICNPVEINTFIKKFNLQTFALKIDCLFLRYIDDQNEELCINAVIENPYAIQYVKNQTNKLCICAIENQPYTIQYIKDQTHELCMLALKYNPCVIGYIKNQTPELCIYAI